MFYKRNLITIGVAILVVFAVAIRLVGLGIDRTAREIHRKMLEDVGRYRTGLIALDFSRTRELANSIQEYTEAYPRNNRELEDFIHGLIGMDPKVTRIWYWNNDEPFVIVDTLGTVEKDAVLVTALKKIAKGTKDRAKSKLYYWEGTLYWTYVKKVRSGVVGIDISLPALHDYFAGMNQQVKSYVYILNEEAILLTHPDETRLGRRLANQDDDDWFDKVLRENTIIHCSGYSQYLLLPVERIYYPVSVGCEKWVIVVNYPEMIIQEEIDGFHRYTLIIAIFTVLVFSLLLVFSQYKWRKEYDRRKQWEQEALQLNLHQLKNQINPHFLFNALNSLAALIGNRPLLAKEFVLKLSKIYRYVLENRNETLIAARNELEFIQHYYFLQKIRFGEQLNLVIDKGVDREEGKIPVMSLQMLVENAIKHNEITRKHPLDIHIYLDRCCLIVENNYCPRTDLSEDSLGVGFENICKIYSYCSDRQFTYGVENDRFVCRLPLI